MPTRSPILVWSQQFGPFNVGKINSHLLKPPLTRVFSCLQLKALLIGLIPHPYLYSIPSLLIQHYFYHTRF